MSPLQFNFFLSCSNVFGRWHERLVWDFFLPWPNISKVPPGNCITLEGQRVAQVSCLYIIFGRLMLLSRNWAGQSLSMRTKEGDAICLFQWLVFSFDHGMLKRKKLLLCLLEKYVFRLLGILLFLYSSFCVRALSLCKRGNNHGDKL